MFIGEKTVLDINTSMGDVSQLGHASALFSGQQVPVAQRWHGSPAQRTDLNYLRVSAKPYGAFRRVRFSAATLFCVFFLYLPLIEGGVFLLLTAVPMLGQVLDPRTVTRSRRRALYANALVSLWYCSSARCSSASSPWPSLPAPAQRVRQAGQGLSPVRVPRPAPPGDRADDRREFFTHLFGDSSFIVYYLRWIGYDLCEVEQTGLNFGTEVGHETPFLSTIGSGTMVADGLSIMNADFSTTSFRVSPVYIGPATVSSGTTSPIRPAAGPAITACSRPRR